MIGDPTLEDERRLLEELNAQDNLLIDNLQTYFTKFNPMGGNLS
jgi:hypothetical protein